MLELFDHKNLINNFRAQLRNDLNKKKLFSLNNHVYYMH